MHEVIQIHEDDNVAIMMKNALIMNIYKRGTYMQFLLASFTSCAFDFTT